VPFNALPRSDTYDRVEALFLTRNAVRHHAISRNAASDEGATLVVNDARDCCSPDFFDNLRQRVLFEMTRVAVEFADPFGELFRRH
jgi:hypothetical protein